MMKTKYRLKLTKRQARAVMLLIEDELITGDNEYLGFDEEALRKLLTKLSMAMRKVGWTDVLNS